MLRSSCTGSSTYSLCRLALYMHEKVAPETLKLRLLLPTSHVGPKQAAAASPLHKAPPLGACPKQRSVSGPDSALMRASRKLSSYPPNVAVSMLPMAQTRCSQ